MNYKKISFLLLMLICSTAGFAEEKTKHLVNTYKVTSATTVEVVNKYGKIKVIPWDHDSVKIEVNMVVTSSNPERLQKQYDNVDFDFIHTPGFITARTLIGGRTTSVWTDISTLTRSMFSNGSDMTIDYTIYMPAKNKLVLENKYGDIYIGHMLSNVKIDLSHGNLKVAKIGGQTDILLKYGEASIKEINTGIISLEYSDLQLDEAEKLKIDNKSGNIKLGNINHLSYDARRGEYDIKSVQTIIGKSTFAEMNIGEVETKVFMESSYGDITINKVNANFDKIDFNAKYSDIDIHFEPTSTFKVNINHKNSTITFPQDKAELTTTSSSDDEKDKVTNGKIGLAGNPVKTLRVEMERATLNIYLK